ncbi:hypothetical protein JVU11DRAFT_9693 [Chiua virens]|nr:hypothetical protein JVU11DRAFT_9693 [Chiua virens]
MSFSRRKMKCDGVRPVCTPCLRGERVEDCEYTDGQRRARTLALEDDIARLQARVQELENPDTAIPSVELYNPYSSAGPGPSTAIVPSPLVPIRAQAASESPISHHRIVPTRHVPSPSGSATQSQGVNFDVEVRFALIIASSPFGDRLSIISPYSAELGLFLNLDRLHALRHTDPACAADCAYALNLASHVLLQAQSQFASALGAVDAEPDPAVFLHVIQTGVLLAYYMQRIGQLVAAKYYASGTWALGMMLKLHRGPDSAVDAQRESQAQRRERERLPPGTTSMDVSAFVGRTELASPLDAIEAEERVRAFWAMYALDRWFSAVGQGPSQSLAMDGSAGDAITVPWPGSGVNEARADAVQQFLHDPNHSYAGDGAVAMHAKASVLLGETTAIVTSYTSDQTISQSPAFRARFGTLDVLLQKCLNATMSMVTTLGQQPPTQEQRQATITIHLVALAHVILHRPFISTYGPSRRRCVEGALGVVRVLDQTGLKIGCISPIYAIVWTACCLALHDEVLRIRARPDTESRRREEGEMMTAIQRLVGVLSCFSQRCPSRFFAAKIEAVLPILESIMV